MNFIHVLINGARFFTIVERVDSGLNREIAFSIYGYESGMQITTQEGEEESTPPKILLCESYDKTLRWITDNEFNPTCVISSGDKTIDPSTLTKSGEASSQTLTEAYDTLWEFIDPTAAVQGSHTREQAQLGNLQDSCAE